MRKRTEKRNVKQHDKKSALAHGLIWRDNKTKAISTNNLFYKMSSKVIPFIIYWHNYRFCYLIFGHLQAQAIGFFLLTQLGFGQQTSSLCI